MFIIIEYQELTIYQPILNLSLIYLSANFSKTDVLENDFFWGGGGCKGSWHYYHQIYSRFYDLTPIHLSVRRFYICLKIKRNALNFKRFSIAMKYLSLKLFQIASPLIFYPVLLSRNSVSYTEKRRL